MPDMTQLSDRHKLAALFVANGLSNHEIAQELNIAPSTISQWQKSLVFKDEVARHRHRLASLVNEATVMKVTKHFDDHAEDMASVITTLAKGAESESVMLGAAKDALDRSSVGIVTRASKDNKGQITNNVMAIVPDQQFLHALLQAAQDTGASDILDTLAESMKNVTP